MHGSVNFKPPSSLEQAAAPVWTLFDDFTTSFTEYQDAHDGEDIPSRLKAMRRSYTSSFQLLHWLEAFKRTMCGRMEQFEQEIWRFESYISRTADAMNYGLNLLPDELLSEIFVPAATTLENKVTLSLVCNQFRRVMMSMRKMWDSHCIKSNEPPEQIFAIAEGNGFVYLKACIYPPFFLRPIHVKNWVAKRALNLEEYLLRYHKFSVGLILSLGPEELEFPAWSERDWKETGPTLISGNMQNVRRLVMIDSQLGYSLGIGVLPKWHMPLLQTLMIDFAPGPSFARNLVRCRLEGIEEAQYDELQNFLAAARFLQGLRLFLSRPNVMPTLDDACDLPSLRSLEVNFVPHPSLAKRLIRFRLVSWLEVVGLTELLDVLSSSNVLQELTIRSSSSVLEHPGTIDASPAVTMPSVVACELAYKMGATLVAKLRMPMLRTLRLDLRGLDKLSGITRNEFRTSLTSMSSLEELELVGGPKCMS